MTLRTPFYITQREPGFIAVRDRNLRPVAAFVDQNTADAFITWANEQDFLPVVYQSTGSL